MRMALADGTTWQVTATGEGSPLLLLHGFAGSGETFRAWLGESVAGHRLVAPDLLGHGASDAPIAPRHAVERQAADLATLLARLDAAPAVVLGYSFGARVALRLAIDHPASVGRLVLVSPSAGITDPEQRAARVVADARWARLLREDGMGDFVAAWETQPIFASHVSLAPDVRARLRRERLANHAEGLARSLEGGGQGAMAPLGGVLERIRVPALVVSGDLDPVGTTRALEVAAGIPGTHHIRLPRAGHTPHVEDPAALATAIGPALRDTSIPISTRSS